MLLLLLCMRIQMSVMVCVMGRSSWCQPSSGQGGRRRQLTERLRSDRNRTGRLLIVLLLLLLLLLCEHCDCDCCCSNGRLLLLAVSHHAVMVQMLLLRLCLLWLRLLLLLLLLLGLMLFLFAALLRWLLLLCCRLCLFRSLHCARFVRIGSLLLMWWLRLSLMRCRAVRRCITASRVRFATATGNICHHHVADVRVVCAGTINFVSNRQGDTMRARRCSARGARFAGGARERVGQRSRSGRSSGR